jgi:hypothetical protein
MIGVHLRREGVCRLREVAFGCGDEVAWRRDMLLIRESRHRDNTSLAPVMAPIIKGGPRASTMGYNICEQSAKPKVHSPGLGHSNI